MRRILGGGVTSAPFRIAQQSAHSLRFLRVLSSAIILTAFMCNARRLSNADIRLPTQVNVYPSLEDGAENVFIESSVTKCIAANHPERHAI